MNVRITPAPDPTLTVSIDFHRGAGMQEVLSTAAPTPVPEAYKFGFVASTGLFTEVHLIRNVVVRPVVERPALSLVKRIAEDAQLPDPVPAGTEVPYEYVVTNTGNMSITDLAVFDDVVGFVTCPRTTLDVGDTIVCRGRYTVTPQDALRGTITNVAWATGMADDTEAESPPDEVTIRVTEAEDAPLDLDKIVDDSRPYRPGERVASRYVVTNDSTRTVDGVRVEDSHVANIRCEDTILAPGASTTCTGTFVVPRRGEGRPECDRGGCRFSVTNTAVARAGDLTSPQARATIRVVAHTPPHICKPGKKHHPGCRPRRKPCHCKPAKPPHHPGMKRVAASGPWTEVSGR